MTIDYERARERLETTLAQVEGDYLQGVLPQVGQRDRHACDVLFQSRTQAYREVLLGCLIARLEDTSINIRQPYLDQGPNAFSGRTLDEKVINPFFHDKRIPSSRGPYLSVFRRSVQFDATTRSGLRDRAAYDAFLDLIGYIESEVSQLDNVLQYLLSKFVELREKASVPLTRLQRVSLEQYDTLLSQLLDTASGGRFPVLFAVATFSAIKEFFHLDWDIRWQGINVADRASGAGGDINIVSGGQTILAAEVTERPIDRSRVVATFNTKIGPAGIEDYLFFYKHSGPTPEATRQAHQYFAQGHEVNFIEVKNWILVSLATMGKKGRVVFNRTLVDLLSAPDIPAGLKVAWNEQVARIATGQD